MQRGRTSSERRPQGATPFHIIHPRLYYDDEGASQGPSKLKAKTLVDAFRPFHLVYVLEKCQEEREARMVGMWRYRPSNSNCKSYMP
jgi:hypothetical protein